MNKEKEIIMNVTIALRDDQPELLNRIKQVRKTRNSNQVFREALYVYGEKILPEFVHQCTKSKNERENNDYSTTNRKT